MRYHHLLEQCRLRLYNRYRLMLICYESVHGIPKAPRRSLVGLRDRLCNPRKAKKERISNNYWLQAKKRLRILALQRDQEESLALASAGSSPSVFLRRNLDSRSPDMVLAYATPSLSQNTLFSQVSQASVASCARVAVSAPPNLDFVTRLSQALDAGSPTVTVQCGTMTVKVSGQKTPAWTDE